MRHRVFLFAAAIALVLLLAGPTRAWAAWHSAVYTEDGSGVAIEVSSPFDSAPPTGYLPLWITIRNSSGAARTWNFISSNENVSSGENKQVATESLRVENGESARFPVLMPLPASASGYYYRTHTFQIEGYGITERSISAPGVNTTTKYSGTPVLGMSEDLATPIWAGLTKWYTDHGLDLMGSPVDLGLLSGDWRALVGLDILWVSDSGYTSLDATRRGVIRDWVSQGGQLCVCAQSADPALRVAVGLPETGDTADVGLGHVQLLPWDGKPLPLDRVTDFKYPGTSHSEPLAANAEDWSITKAVGEIQVNAPLLICFIIVFAAVVGPINLFVFANSARRHRLFWTTPVISVAASLLLIFFIFLQDGFGGAGQRAMLCLLLPDQKKIVVFQEQVARTGVLMSRQFHTTEDLVFTPLHLDRRGTRSYQQTGRNYSGDWFASRSVQAHRMEAIVPSRAEIQIVSADGAPVVVSSVPAAIRKICYLDPSGKHWIGDSLRTGERITLRAGESGERDFATDASPAMAEKIRLLSERRGYFVAVADKGPFFETLPSIHWNTQRTVFAGAVSTVAR